MSICGAFVALCGMTVYTSLNIQEKKHDSSNKQMQKPNLPSTKPISSAQDGADSDVKDSSNNV